MTTDQTSDALRPDECREKFERWFSDNGASPKAIEKGADGEYLLASAYHNWKAWQAAWDARADQSGWQPLKWVLITPRFGSPYHVFNVHKGPVKLISASTRQKTRIVGRHEPLWYGTINTEDYGPFWEESDALEVMEAALKFCGFAPQPPQEGSHE